MYNVIHDVLRYASLGVRRTRAVDVGLFFCHLIILCPHAVDRRTEERLHHIMWYIQLQTTSVSTRLVVITPSLEMSISYILYHGSRVSDRTRGITITLTLFTHTHTSILNQHIKLLTSDLDRVTS